MRRRIADPLAPLKPVARLAAVGLVATVGMLGAVQIHAQPAQVSTTLVSASNGASEATAEADTLLAAVHLPPGAIRLTSKPANAPAAPTPEGDMVTQTQWWSTNTSAADVLSWVAAHPTSSTVATLQEWSGSGIQSPRVTDAVGFDGNSAGVLYELYVGVTPFTLSGGRTGIEVTASVYYRPARTPQETIPVTAKLVVSQILPGVAGNGGTVTTTDPGVIGQVARIINGLPTAPLGPRYCPMNNGAGISLSFESSSGTVLYLVSLETSGCGGSAITVAGHPQPPLAGNVDAAGQVVSAIGAHWHLMG